MFYAKTQTLETIQAAPGLTGFCPLCRKPVFSRCGTLRRWHFAHNDERDCDPWFEYEGDWHYQWKSLVPLHMREIVIRREVHDTSGPIPRTYIEAHRADILNSRQTVIELQHSYLSAEEARIREEFYVHMIWLWDGIKSAKQFSTRRVGDTLEFTWKKSDQKMKTFSELKKPIFIDFGGRDNIFQVRSLFDLRNVTMRQTRGWFRGTGRFIDKKTFKEMFFV